MIVIMSVEELFKKKKRRKKLLDQYATRDFTIVNTTTLPKMRDLPKVMSDIHVDSTGMRCPSTLDSLTYQMPDSIFNENIPIEKRRVLVDKFFLVQGFQEYTLKLIGWQILHQNKNMYIVLDDMAYEKYVDRYVKEIHEMLGTDNVIYTWNSINKMRDCIRDQALAHVRSFDPKKWKEENSIYSSMTMNLDDDEYDEYLDYKEILDALENGDYDNGDIRMCFLKYARYPQDLIEYLAKVIKNTPDLVDQEEI